MKKPITTLIVIAIIIIGFFVAGPFFVINEGEQAVVTQLGRIVNVVTDAGLHFKVPFIDEVHRLPRRIMSWDGEAMRNIPTADNLFIFVDVVARWRISDPQVFFEAVRTVDEANRRLGVVISGEARNVVAENFLRESVRNSNIILERPSNIDDLNFIDNIEAEIALITASNIEPVTRGRRQLAEEILERSRRMVPQYGIELIDVVTRQIRYSDELTPSVYARMIRERNQIATAYRSAGEGSKAEWVGRRDRERAYLLSAAFEQAEVIRGAADAEAARIYAEAHNLTAARRNFFVFWAAIESYRNVIPNFNKVMTTDMDYFRFLHSPTGN